MTSPPPMDHFSIITFFGALAIFMFGIRFSRMGVQLLAGDRLRTLVGSLANNRLLSLITGTLVTLILQSSTATTIMLVGFAASGAITLTQAMGVILGADIGTTFVVILLSIKRISDYALLMLVAGVLLDIFSKRQKSRHSGMVLVGFGFVFFGMQMMVRTTAPLRENPLLIQIFDLLKENPFYAFTAATAFTALVQNSATTLGLTIALTLSGLVNLEGAIPIVLGANVGSCAGSLLSSIGGGPAAKRVALGHLLFKVCGATLAMSLLGPLTHFLQDLSTYFPYLHQQAGAQVALTHVVFNLALSLTFLPLISQGAWLIQKLVPEPYHPEEKTFGPKYLDLHALEMPSLAFANAKREILRMGEMTHEMLKNAGTVLENNDRELREHIEGQEDRIDILDREIKLYLAKISQEGLTSDQARLQLRLVALTTDLEEISDIITKNILEITQKRVQRGQNFSPAGQEEILDLHSKVLENVELCICALATEDEEIARKVIRHEKDLATIEDRYREAHLQRLHKKVKETIATSPLHMDLLSNLRRINTKAAVIAKLAFAGKELF